MGNKFMTAVHMYSWFVKLVGAALLFGLAITLIIVDATQLIEAFVGLVIAIYAMVRLVPFIQTQRSDLIKTINIVEILLNILVAIVFIGAAFTMEESLGALFGYMLAGVLIARGMIHFYGISYGAEKGDHLSYFFHIATLIIGAIIVARGFAATDLLYLLVFLAFLAGGYYTFDGFSGYSRFRRHKQLGTTKEKSAEEEIPKGIDAPSKRDEEKERERDIVS